MQNIEININMNNRDQGPARTNVYVWKDLNHLKSYYSDSIDTETIDHIVKEIQENNSIFKQRSYGMDTNMETHLNERCFCNLVEIFLIDRSEKALQRFFEKPV